MQSPDPGTAGAAAALVHLGKLMAGGKSYREALAALPATERRALAARLAAQYGDDVEGGMKALRDLLAVDDDEDEDDEEQDGEKEDDDDE